jgi:hypothetical protein
MKLEEVLKNYADYLNDNVFKKTLDTRVENQKMRAYYYDQFKAQGLNPEYFRLIKLSNKFVDFTDFLEMIPKEERPLYEKQKDLILEFLDVVQSASIVRMNKIAQSKKLSAEIKKIDPMAKYVLNYFKNLKYAEIELQKHLKNKTVSEIVEKYKFIKDLF